MAHFTEKYRVLPSGVAGSRHSGAAVRIFSLLHSDCVCERESTGEPALGNEDRPSLKQDGAGISITKHKKSLSFLETEIGECTATVRVW